MSSQPNTPNTPKVDVFVYDTETGETKKDEKFASFVDKVIARGNSLRKQGLCPGCEQQVTSGFRNSLSKQEYKISGMCQACQDQLFAGTEEDDDQ